MNENNYLNVDCPHCGWPTLDEEEFIWDNPVEGRILCRCQSCKNPFEIYVELRVKEVRV